MACVVIDSSLLACVHAVVGSLGTQLFSDSEIPCMRTECAHQPFHITVLASVM